MNNRNWTSKAQKFASLAAAGAGAISLTASKAEASIITSNVLNTVIGFSSAPVESGGNTAAVHLFNTFASGPQLLFKALSFHNGSFYTRRVIGSDVSFQALSSVISPFSAGEIFHSSLGRGGNLVAQRSWATSGSSTSATGNAFDDKYYLFRFNNGGVKYGWVEASLALANEESSNPAFGPNLTVIRYAFDNSGAPIAAGEVGSTTPEPATLTETGIGALLLGAEGLRRWRKSRKAA